MGKEEDRNEENWKDWHREETLSYVDILLGRGDAKARGLFARPGEFSFFFDLPVCPDFEGLGAWWFGRSWMGFGGFRDLE